MASAIPESIARMEAEVEGRAAACSRRAQDALDEACAYARASHLTIDGDEIDPLFLFRATTQAHVDDLESSPNDAHLPVATLRPLTGVTERLSVGQAAVKLLEETFANYSEHMVREAITDLCAIHHGDSDLKLEVPILRSHHELDCEEYREVVQYATKASRLTDHGFPMDPANVEKDEGLPFPRTAFAAGARLSEAARAEKIEIRRSCAVYIEEAMALSKMGVPHDRDRLIEELATYRKNTARESLTPPFAARSPPFEYFIPEGDACEVPMSSKPASPSMSSDVRVAEEAVFRLGKLTSCGAGAVPEADPLAPFLLHEEDPVEFLESAAPSTLQPADLILDVPLISNDQGPQYEPTSVNLQDVALAVAWEKIGGDKAIAEADQLTVEVMADIAAKVARRAEQEQLQPLDARARVPVPVMDFSTSPANWDVGDRDPRTIFDFLAKQQPGIFTLSVWRGDKGAERKMRWVPFDSKAARLPPETIEFSEESVGSFYDLPGPVPTSFNYVWKASGLAILNERVADDEEDLEAAIEDKEQAKSSQGDVQGDDDLMSLIRKRTKRMAAGSRAEPLAGLAKSPEDVHGSNNGRDRWSGLLVGEGDGHTSNIVDRYIELRAPGKRAHETSSFFPAPPLSRSTKASNSIDKRQQITLEPQEPLAAAPHPPFDASATPPKVILALSLSRGIRKHLELALPNLGYVERDYNAYNSSMWIPGTVSRSEVASTFSDEADVILSPATGIVITTMVKVRQKSVPGTNGITVFRDRLSRVAVRYEKLILLVSEGSKDETLGEMSPSDAVALAELQGYVLGLDTDIAVYYVGGGEQTVARWVASFACRSDEAVDLDGDLIDVETHGELFLRRLGINVYAAQLVERTLAAPNENPEDVVPYGLHVFAQMPAEERIARFGGGVGGRRVLDRVSGVVDASWQ